MKSLKAMMDEQGRKAAVAEAVSPSAPDPSQREIHRQHVLIAELFNRIDALSQALVKLGAMPPPNVVNNLPEMQVNVEAPEVEVAAPNVTVQAPTVNVASPTVNVQPPRVSVEAPSVNVNPPQVYVSAPNVSVDAPNITVTPSVTLNQPRKWVFTHEYSGNSNRPHTTVAEAIDY